MLFSEVLRNTVSFLHVPEEFFEQIIVRLQDTYCHYLDPETKKLDDLSKLGNLLGAIQEVCYVIFHCLLSLF